MKLPADGTGGSTFKGITDGRFMSWLLWKSLKDDYLSEVEILQDLRAAPEPLVGAVIGPGHTG